MNRVIVKSTVGSDGTLHLDLPLGLSEADREVQITIKPVAKKNALTPEEWRSWVQSMAGSWQGPFERMPQGQYEERATLS